MTTPVYIITDWSDHFENNRTRQLENLRWVPIPNQFDGDKISELIERAGADGYGAWCALLLVAGKCQDRGTLLRSKGRPHTPASLSRITGLPADAFDKMLTVAADVGLIEANPLSDNNPAPERHPSVTRTSPERHPSANGVRSSDYGMEGNGREENIARAERPPGEIWDSVCEQFELKPVTKSDKSRVGKITRDLKAKEATPEKIARTLRAHRQKWPKVDPVTPESLVKHWDQLQPSRHKPRDGIPRREKIRAHLSALARLAEGGEDVSEAFEAARVRLTPTEAQESTVSIEIDRIERALQQQGGGSHEHATSSH